MRNRRYSTPLCNKSFYEAEESYMTKTSENYVNVRNDVKLTYTLAETSSAAYINHNFRQIVLSIATLYANNAPYSEKTIN